MKYNDNDRADYRNFLRGEIKKETAQKDSSVKSYNLESLNKDLKNA